jgi:autotransporter family porin
MTNSALTRSQPALRERLLNGASATVIVLALGLALTDGAAAQTTEASNGQTYQTGADDAAIAAGFREPDTGNATITIDINNADDTTATFVNDDTGGTDQTLTIVVVDNSADGTANALTLSGDAVASNGGTIAIQVGEGTTQPVNLVIEGNVTETASGDTVTIQLGAGGSDPTVNLTFDASGATQTINSAISVADDGDVASLIIANSAGAASTTTFTDTVTLGAADTISIGGAVGTTAVFQANVTAPGGISLDATNADATLVLGASGATTTVTGNLDVADTTNGATLSIADGANVTLAGDVDSTAAWDGITIGGGTTATTFTLQGDMADDAPITINDQGRFVIDATGGARTLTGATTTINADAAGSTVTLETVGDAADGNGVTINGTVGNTGAIDTLTMGDDTTFAESVVGGVLTAATNVLVTLQGAANALTGNVTGDGSLVIGDGATDVLSLGGGAGTTSTVSIANLDGPGDIAIVAGSAVTISTTVGDGVAISDFTLDAADTSLTINAAGTEAVTGGGNLTLGEGTLILGSNIGAGDTVFEFTADGGLVTEANDTLTVQLSANFTTGQIILADTGADQTAAHDDVTGDGEISVTSTALTTYTLGDGGDNTEIAITAAATTTAQAATTLGVTTGQADALRQAVTSADTAGDTSGLDSLSTALNAGGTQATAAAQQVGVQGETLAGGAQTAFSAAGAQQTVTGNRLAGARGGDARFASAFASSESGFSGGDLDGFYAAPGPRYANAFWIEGFGGIANADGDTLNAGYDAGFGGGMIGVEGAVTDTITLGAFGSYTYAMVDGDGAGNAELESNSFGVGVYGSYTTQSFYVDGFASYASSQNDANRTAFGQAITADYDASQFALGAAAGVPIEVAQGIFITPNASLTYNYYQADSYTETGSLGFSATVDPGSATQLTGTVGARVHAVYENVGYGGTAFIPELRVALIGDLVDDDAVSTATFTGGGTAYAVTGTETDDIGALVGVGLSFDNASWSAGLAYDADLRSDYQSHAGRAEFRWKF